MGGGDLVLVSGFGVVRSRSDVEDCDLLLAGVFFARSRKFHYLQTQRGRTHAIAEYTTYSL
jgi:hypothetical protein